MFKRSIVLFNLWGFQVRLDPSWIILAIFLTWTLSEGLFPYYYPGLNSSTYLWMGLVCVIGLFGSIVLHEFGHSIVARSFGLPMRGITLFLFGGVAEMAEEPSSPLVEFLMALAGPATSFLILLFFAACSFMGTLQKWPVEVTGVTTYLAILNGILIIFNLVPAFPLDGGRVFRAILWQWKKDLQRATRITANMGRWFGAILIFLGILNALHGQVLGGLWWVFIGFFLRGAADASYQQLLMQQQLKGQSVKQFMKTDMITVPSEISIQELVERYFYKHYFKGYPVLTGEKLVGHVSLPQVQNLPRDEWHQHFVSEIMEPLSEDNTISTNADAMEALTKMQKTGNTRLMVVENQHLVGLLSLKDLLHVFTTKLEIEQLH